MDLFSPVTALKGVGAVRAKQLAKLHIETLYDLIAFFPRDYEDRTKLCSIAGLKPGEPACFEAMVISNPQLSRIRKGMELVKVRVADETGRVDLVFFNQPYVRSAQLRRELPLLWRAPRRLRSSDAEPRL